MRKDITIPEPFLSVFPEPEDVFAEPVDQHFRHLLPLLSIDLAVINPAWSGRVHLVCPTEPAGDAPLGAYTQPFHSDYTNVNWLGFRLDSQSHYSLIGDFRYFILDNYDPNEEVHDSGAEFSSLEKRRARVRMAYDMGKQRFHKFNRLHSLYGHDKGPRTDRCNPIAQQLGGTAFPGNWAAGKHRIKLDKRAEDDVAPLTVSGRRFDFIAQVAATDYAQDDGNPDFMIFGPDAILLFFNNEERIALQTFEWS